MRTSKLRDLAGLVGTDASVNINVNPCTDRQVWANFREVNRILGMICKAKIPQRSAGAAPAVQNMVKKATCNATWAASTAEYWDVTTDDDDGGGPITVRLRKPSNTPSFGEPVLRNGDKVLYMLDSAGVAWAVSDFLGPALGTIDFWVSGKASIPAGWGLADGTGNAAGSGYDLRTWMFEGARGFGIVEIGDLSTPNPIDFEWIVSGTIATGTAVITVGDPVAPWINFADISQYFILQDHNDRTGPSTPPAQTVGPFTITLDPSGLTITTDDATGRSTSYDSTDINWDGMSRDGQHSHPINTSPIMMNQVSGKHPRSSISTMEDAWKAHFHRITDPGHFHPIKGVQHPIPTQTHTHLADPHDHDWTETPPHTHTFELDHSVSGMHRHIQDPHTHQIIDAGHEHTGIEDDSATIPLHSHISNKPERITIIPMERIA